MARQRRNQGSGDPNKGTNSSSSNGSNSTNNRSSKSSSLLSYWKQIIGCIVLGIAVSLGYMGYLETRVNTPFDDKKMVVRSGLEVPEQYWGSYRPGLYFGLKTRDPMSLVTGLMWYFPKRLRPGGDGIRHWCEQNDGLEKYGWVKHDGSNFGVQEIIDGGYTIDTSFVKRLGGSHGGDWTARITVTKPGNFDDVSLIWYTALDEETKGFISLTNSATKFTGIKGETSGLGEFTIKFTNSSGIVSHESFLSTIAPGLHLLKETVVGSLRLAQDKPNSPRRIILGGEILPEAGTGKAQPNFVAVQLTGKVPFSVDVVFESGSFGTRQDTLVGETYTKALAWHEARFGQRFEDTFGLHKKGYGPKEVSFAQAALSNMLGGIGYFFGTSKVQSFYTKEPVHYWRAPLYTGVPSRSFFPRGFLWDEGFHGFLIATWDLDLELDIISHWFDLMNVEGWIPREQILGVEALAKIPEEFVVQRNTNANPPTFFLTLQFILRKYYDKLSEGRLATLERLYPRLQAWFAWFNTTQKGAGPGMYRWRGRDASTNRELNPKTLTSGLDDYPRASHPTENEYHVDLYCWIAIAADTLARLATLLDRDGYKYEQTADYLKDNFLLDNLHWSNYASRYSDYGYHTDSVKLKRPKPLPRSQNQNMEMVRVTLKNPEYRLVDSTFGYVSLFPFLLQMVDSDSLKLGQILDDLRNPDLLWTKFGLRSLSKNSPLYMKRNTEHDPPYWRGQIWININFLAVRALYFYANTEGPYRDKANTIYKELRENVIKNVMTQYFKTGYLWEQYNDETGEGSGCRPFTGWTALVVLLMGEQY
ncbi:mannosyl-oligosaccharide glucosidase [Tribolium madens]|uniref:mannosyl-oligosaccharide glucosidase n=1 Tax=Tribolium madens TaxID=41895 RepID=UPI001CF73CF1|nr:mannosyl-oligosaccharide glucosidase [Tribolium madens]